jgi:hypothetical protein
VNVRFLELKVQVLCEKESIEDKKNLGKRKKEGGNFD